MGASRPRPAVQAREAGLELIRRINRWLIAAAVAATGLLSLLAAHAFHGRTLTAGQSIVELERSVVELKGPTVEPFLRRPISSSSNAGSSGLQAPAQAPAPAPSAAAPVVSGGS